MLHRILKYFDFSAPDPKAALRGDIAVRSKSSDWLGFESSLPDPDPVLRKLGQDIRVYRELLADAHVWSCYQSRKSGTLSSEWEIRESAKGGVRLNREAARLVKEMMDGLDVYQIISDALDAPFFGISPLELVWGRQGGYWLPEKVVGRPPEWFKFGADNELRFISREQPEEGELVRPGKIILARHHANYQNPYGERLLARCFWPVTFKKNAIKFWAVFTEKFGMPWVIGKVPRGAPEAQREAVLVALDRMVQDAVAVVNDDESIEFPESHQKQSSADTYEKLISSANREISKAILGQTLTTELDQGGSYAAAREHMEIRQNLIDQDKRMVAGCFNELFRLVVNFNLSGAQTPVFSFFEEKDIKKERAQRDKLLVEQGLKLSRDYYLRTYNLEENDIIKSVD